MVHRDLGTTQESNLQIEIVTLSCSWAFNFIIPQFVCKIEVKAVLYLLGVSGRSKENLCVRRQYMLALILPDLSTSAVEFEKTAYCQLCE